MALLALTLALLAITTATEGITMKRLDMALNSFDDQYQGCGPAMEAALPALNRSEMQKNPLFAKAWSQAMGMWLRVGSRVSPLSSSDLDIVILTYESPYLNEYFNRKVSVVGRSPQAYRDNFHFKTLHFLLSKIVAMLRATQKGQKCQCVIHADLKYKFYANPGGIVRLGQFAVLYGCIDDIHGVEAGTVLQVQTCHSVNIKAFFRNPSTDVMLIPPYEKFKVTNVIDYGEKVEIHLDSIGTYSKYNCEWLKGGDSLGPWGQPGAMGTHTGAMGTPTAAMGIPMMRHRGQ
ncbi:erythroblast NAD(P)(+)--arginine ADP-ribosyltransferase-like protein [Turdus rufiventris]|nr:erythroblast NAD(P)(+)--arginine ADP-ribosyltransferase-like protein [Turdus rufiventris]